MIIIQTVKVRLCRFPVHQRRWPSLWSRKHASRSKTPSATWDPAIRRNTGIWESRACQVRNNMPNTAYLKMVFIMINTECILSILICPVFFPFSSSFLLHFPFSSCFLFSLHFPSLLFPVTFIFFLFLFFFDIPTPFSFPFSCFPSPFLFFFVLFLFLQFSCFMYFLSSLFFPVSFTFIFTSPLPFPFPFSFPFLFSDSYFLSFFSIFYIVLYPSLAIGLLPLQFFTCLFLFLFLYIFFYFFLFFFFLVSHSLFLFMFPLPIIVSFSTFPFLFFFLPISFFSSPFSLLFFFHSLFSFSFSCPFFLSPFYPFPFSVSYLFFGFIYFFCFFSWFLFIFRLLLSSLFFQQLVSSPAQMTVRWHLWIWSATRPKSAVVAASLHPRKSLTSQRSLRWKWKKMKPQVTLPSCVYSSSLCGTICDFRM